MRLSNTSEGVLPSLRSYTENSPGGVLPSLRSYTGNNPEGVLPSLRSYTENSPEGVLPSLRSLTGNNPGGVLPEGFLGRISPMPKPPIEGSSPPRFTSAQKKAMAIAIPIILVGIAALFFYIFQAFKSYNRKSSPEIEKKQPSHQNPSSSSTESKDKKAEESSQASLLSDSLLKRENRDYIQVKELTYEKQERAENSPPSLVFHHESIKTATSVSIKAQDMFEACAVRVKEDEKQVIINAANKHLGGGSGIDGLIHVKGGKAYAEAHRAILPYLQSNDDIQDKALLREGYPEGWAISIPSGALKTSHNVEKVIVVSGPCITGQVAEEDEKKLYNCYYNALEVANKIEGITRVIFPSISTGLFHFPGEKAGPIFTSAIFDFLQDHSSTTIREISVHVLKEEDLAQFKVDKFASLQLVNEES